MVRVVSLNQDRGIAPGRSKGAAVHLEAMRSAFRRLGADVLTLDESVDDKVAACLTKWRAEAPLDLIYERYALAKPAGAEFARRAGVPLVLEVNAPLAEEERRYREQSETIEHRQLDRFVFGQADLVIAVSAAVGEYAVARGARPTVTRIRPNGVDLTRFQPRESGSSSNRRNELAPPDRLVLGFHGRLRPWHGFENLVSVCSELLRRKAPIHLVVVGEGNFDEQLTSIPEAHRTIVGWTAHDEVGSYVAAFDVLPLTYPPDLPCYFSPLKLAEAMACGVVPIVPDLGDLPRVVEAGISGEIYAAGDWDSLATIVQRLLEKPDRQKALSIGAINRARLQSWDRIAAEALELAL